MIRSVVPFQRWHLEMLEENGVAEGEVVKLPNDILAALEQQGSWTFAVDGEPMMCGGTVQIWPGRSTAWAFISKKAGPHLLFLTRGARDCLAKVKGRIEMTVRIGFDEGRRWAALLGFYVETPYLSAYGPEGEPHTAFVRFN